MHFGHETWRTVTRQLALLLKHSWRLALMGMLFALTCWEVKPAQMPVPEEYFAAAAASGSVAASQTARGLTSTQWIAAGDERIGAAPEG